MSSLLAVSGVIAFALPSPTEGDCEGAQGLFLDLPPVVTLGETFTVCMQGPPNVYGLFLASTGQGPIESKWGTLCLDLPLLESMVFQFDENGEFCFDCEVDCDVDLIGFTGYAQFVVNKPCPLASNQASLTIEDGICVGDYFSYTPGAYGADCHGDNPACTLEEWFDVLFPDGIKLGDQDGPDGGADGEYTLHFTSLQAVKDFLPGGGPPAHLTGDEIDPKSSSAGNFASALLAAKINQALDDAGALDDRKLRPDRKLTDLLFAANVNPDLFDLSVMTVIDICDLAISGILGDGDLDIDLDGDQDSTLSDLTGALNGLNENFDNGTVNRGSLKLH
jgi:hypothetical protein